jgi:very-short-patch-repair endonuclease
MVLAVQTAREVKRRCFLVSTDPRDAVFDPMCVRKGTRVWVPTPALLASGEGAGGVPHARQEGASGDTGEGADGLRAIAVDQGNVLSPVQEEVADALPPVQVEVVDALPPMQVQVADALPPVHGGSEGGRVHLVPIEDLWPGDFVLGHDGLPHRTLRVLKKSYRGPMIGLRCAPSPVTLWLTSDHGVLCGPRPRSLGGNRDWSAIPGAHFERSRELRHEASPPERLLWSALRNKQLGYKFRRQHPIGPYIADFYSREAHVVVEVDGSTHFTEESAEYDAGRDAYMRSLGLDVLRFTTSDVQQNLEGVCLAIQEECRRKTESPEGAEWAQSGSLQLGDVVFVGPSQQALPIKAVESEYGDEEVYDLEVEGVHSFITELCTVHDCSSGTGSRATPSARRSRLYVDG